MKITRTGSFHVLGALAFSGALWTTNAHAASTRYVTLGGIDLSDCASSRPGCATIAYATTRAKSGDTILVDRPSFVGFVENEVRVDKDLTLRGLVRAGGVPRLLAAPSQRHFHVTSGATLTLVDLTLTTDLGPQQSGGGVTNEGTLVVERCTLDGNSAGNGGAIFNLGDVDLSYAEFLGNSATSHGGAIFSPGGSIRVTAATVFSGNHAGEEGGAIQVDSPAFASLSGVVFTGNDAENGGAVSSTSASLSILDADFSDNVAEGAGGAISVQGLASLVVEGTRFYGNAAIAGGAISSSGTVWTSVTHSTFDENHAELDGGAMRLYGHTLDLDESHHRTRIGWLIRRPSRPTKPLPVERFFTNVASAARPS